MANVSTTVTFDTAANFTYATSKIQISSGAAQLINIPPYDTTNPTIAAVNPIDMSAMAAFVESKTASGSDAVQYILTIGSTDYYWSGAAWVASNGTYAQSNSAATINTNCTHASLTALLGTGSHVYIKAFLHSFDGSTTPVLSNVTFTYTFAGIKPTSPATCIVYAWLKDILGADVGSVQSAQLSVTNNDGFKYGNFLVVPFNKSAAFDSNGYAQIQLMETTTPGYTVNFAISYTQGKSTRQIFFSPVMIPNSGSVALTSISTAVSAGVALSGATQLQSYSFIYAASASLAGQVPVFQTTDGRSVIAQYLVDANISSSAAIAMSKLSSQTANTIAKFDSSGYLAPVGALTAGLLLKTDTNGLPATLTAITANSLLRSDINGLPTALASISASKALVSDANGLPVASVTTTTELSYVSGVTSAIQTQLNSKIGTTLTSAHILVGNGSNIATDVAMSGDITITNAGVTAYNGTVGISKGGTGQITKAAAFDALQPMTTGGDLIYGGASGTGTRLANGSANQVLQSNGTTLAPTWTTNIAGNAANVTGVVVIANGGTNNASLAVTAGGTLYTDGSKIVNVGAGSSGQVLQSNAASPPTWTTNITGSAGNVTGTVAIGNGGTGQTTKAAAFDALQPMTTGGDLIYGGASGTGTRLANGTAGQVLQSNGTTLAPSWATLSTSNFAASSDTFNAFGTVTSKLGKQTSAGLYRARGNVVCGTVAASTASVSLATSINTTIWGSVQTQVGTWQSLENVALTQGTLFYDGSDATKIYFCQTTDGSKNYVKMNGNSIANNSETLQLNFEYPI